MNIESAIAIVTLFAGLFLAYFGARRQNQIPQPKPDEPKLDLSQLGAIGMAWGERDQIDQLIEGLSKLNRTLSEREHIHEVRESINRLVRVLSDHREIIEKNTRELAQGRRDEE